MKYKMLIAVLAIFSTTAYGQWQVSASSGYAVGSAGMKLGERITTTETENSYGSYGEGTNFQLRGTYFFDDSFGFDLGNRSMRNVYYFVFLKSVMRRVTIFSDFRARNSKKKFKI